MAFKKQISSSRPNASFVVAGGNQAELFPVGFKYMIGDTTYEVIKKSYTDNTEFRRLLTSENSVEDVMVDTIIRDLRSAGGSPNGEVRIINDPDAEAKAKDEAEPEEGETKEE